VSRPKISEIIK